MRNQELHKGVDGLKSLGTPALTIIPPRWLHHLTYNTELTFSRSFEPTNC